MTRWSLSNIFRKLNFTQFTDLSTEFKNAAEQIFGTECAVDITLMSRPKAYTTLYDDDEFERLKKINDANTLLKTDSIENVTQEQWNEAGYVEIGVRPITN